MIVSNYLSRGCLADEDVDDDWLSRTLLHVLFPRFIDALIANCVKVM